MEKKVFCLLLVGIILFVFISTETKAQQIVIKAVTCFHKTHSNNDPVPLFIEAVNKRAEGRLRIDWLGGPEVFASFDQIHALKGGSVDMILYYPFGYMKSLMPECEAKGLSELAGWEERKSGTFELWSEIFKKRVNAKYLGTFHGNPLFAFQFHLNKKIDRLADFKGLKIRVMPLYIPLTKALGATPITIAPSDIYTALERGVVDGFMWARWGIMSLGLHEVAKYTIDPGVFQMEPAAMINLNLWKRIPKDLQELLMEVMKDHEYIAAMRGVMIVAKEDRDREKAGMRVIKLPQEDAEKFIKIANNVTWEEVIKIAPEYGPKLRKTGLRANLPKGAFPW